MLEFYEILKDEFAWMGNTKEDLVRYFSICTNSEFLEYSRIDGYPIFLFSNFKYKYTDECFRIQYTTHLSVKQNHRYIKVTGFNKRAYNLIFNLREKKLKRILNVN